MTFLHSSLHATSAKYGLTVKAHRGDGSVLLGFNRAAHLTAPQSRFARPRTLIESSALNCQAK